jgi:hypothetical protein
MGVVPPEWHPDLFKHSLSYNGMSHFHRPGIVFTVELIVALPPQYASCLDTAIMVSLAEIRKGGRREGIVMLELKWRRHGMDGALQGVGCKGESRFDVSFRVLGFPTGEVR